MDTQHILEQFYSDLPGAQNAKLLEELDIKYLGRKNGIITHAFASLKEMPLEEKRVVGPNLNALKIDIERALQEKRQQQLLVQDAQEIDVTLPPLSGSFGRIHPLSHVESELLQIFRSLGFAVVDGPEVESDFYNFTALNVPEDHPARDMQDTFYMNGVGVGGDAYVLRTHTSSVQVRFMEQHKPPFAIVSAGRVYRSEATDSTHDYSFMQCEGLVVGPNVNYAQMVWVLRTVLERFFGNDVKTRLSPAYFPFVEPGAEMALSSPKFQNGRWVEILGCGMVHDKVFEAAGYKKGVYQGFAFGFGLTRFTAMKLGIPDIRLFHENDMRFLQQF